MFKKAIYPKTRRISKGSMFRITEKLDGSNLVLFKLNGVLHIAQRNNIFTLEEAQSGQYEIYKGLVGWLNEHGQELQDKLNETSAVCGEWIGMGKIKYGETLDGIRFHMFAKANIDPELMELKNIVYKNELFIYPFVDQTVPDYIGQVPEVLIADGFPTIEMLDQLYDSYSQCKEHLVEGFVIMNYNNPTEVTKYVRLKNGVLQEHFNWKNN